MNADLPSLSDRELLTETRRVAGTERQTTAALVALLAEVDARRLYLGEGYSSLFAFCTGALHLSEQAAYGRITAARAARRFPTILERLEEGAISLTTVGLLAPHLTDDNHEAVLDAARHQSKRDVERLVAAMQPQPDIPSSIRALPVRKLPTSPIALPELPMEGAQAPAPVSAPETPTDSAPSSPETPTRPAPLALAGASPRRSVVAPIAPTRYLVRITVSEETHRKLERARDLLRHQIPDGDPAAIVDLALTVLIEQAERTKFAATARPTAFGASRSAPPAPSPSETALGRSRLRESQSRSRRIPAAVRRQVWSRDEGRCAFVGTDGRCGETGFLEFHHVVPFAAGGPSGVDNLQLRCRAHNAYEAAPLRCDRPLQASTSPERALALASRRTGSGPS